MYGDFYTGYAACLYEPAVLKTGSADEEGNFQRVGGERENQMNKPHIIWLLSDQHHAKISGFGGDPFVRTPALDSLARNGVVFENCYCNSPLCVPSRSSMLTGKLPDKTQVYNNTQTLGSDDVTLAHCLTVGGYHTVLAGRMHFVGYDQHHGFEERLVGDITPAFPGSDRQSQVYGELKGTPDQSAVSLKKSGPGDSSVLHYDEEVCRAACDYLKKYQRDRPLFLTVGFYGPHCPFVAPKPLYDEYFKKLPERSETEKEEETLHPAIKRWKELRGVATIDPADIRRVRAAYYGMVTSLDRLAGRVLDTVAACLGLENTIVVYCSDHGESLGEHGLFWKSNFYDGAAKVPMILSWKGKWKNGVRIAKPVNLMDLAPTLCAYAEAPDLPAADGVSMRALLEDTGQEERVVISELIDIKGDQPSAMIRVGNYKLIHYCGYDEVQLFDLEKDPEEKRNLAGNPAFAEIREKLAGALFKRWKPDQAARQLEESLKNAQIFKQWTKQANPPGIDQWKADTQNNYLEI